ncbi:hypothetical protein LINPERPRIM_LOCUS35700, partial [Linum perenne]
HIKGRLTRLWFLLLWQQRLLLFLRRSPLPSLLKAKIASAVKVIRSVPRISVRFIPCTGNKKAD